MRILAASPYYSPEGGGLERYAHAILSRLAARGHDVRVLCCTRGKPARTTLDGVAVERVGVPLMVGNTPVHPGFAGHAGRAIRDWRPDVVVGHTPVPFAAEMAFSAASKAGVPFVVTYHAGALRGSSRALHTLAVLDRVTLERRMLAGSARIIAVGPFVRDNALARHRDRVTIIAPGVDNRRFTPGARRPPAPTILFVGPLSRSYRWKGVDVLWEAFPLVREQVPEARLMLIGHGDRYATFSQSVHDEGDGSIELPGRVCEDELIEAYRRAAVVALPSTTEAESFGMVLAEANACGRPVVASAIGGIPDFVRDGDNGLLVRPADPDDLAQKLVALLRDPAAADAMGRRGRERVVREHDWDRLAAATEAVLDEAVRGVARTTPVDAPSSAAAVSATATAQTAPPVSG